MDHERFDALARLLARGGSRRETLGAVLSVALGWPSAALAKDGKGQDKGHGGVQGEGRPGAAHKKHHRTHQTHRRRRGKRRRRNGGSDSGATPTPCAVPCAGKCCAPVTCSIAACIDGLCKHDYVPINAPGPNCADGQCCFGVCCANPDPTCSDNGQCGACQSDAQCPSGHFCCNGQCIEGTCRPTLCACEHDDQCCRGLCEGGGPVDYYCCLEIFEDCTFDSECCTGICDSGHCS
jgi:hypothetical protein